jgi:hypothetical protein
LVLCISSFEATSSSLVACSSSFEVSSSSMVAWRFSWVKLSSAWSSPRRALIEGQLGARLVAEGGLALRGVELEQDVAAAERGRAEGLDPQADQARPLGELGLDAPVAEGRAVAQRLGHAERDDGGHRLGEHVEHVERGRPPGDDEELRGVAEHVHELVRLAHQQRRGGELFHHVGHRPLDRDGGALGRLDHLDGEGPRRPRPERAVRAEVDHRRAQVADALEDLRLAVDRPEVIGHVGDGLAPAEEDEAGGLEREVHQRQGPLLQGGVEVDEEVAAAHQVEAGEGRVFHHVVRREDHRLAHRAGDLVAVPLAHEEARQPLGRDVGADAVRVAGRGGELDGVAVDVGREDLQVEPAAERLDLLVEEDGDGEGLLAGGAARDPDAERVVDARGAHQRGDHLARELLEALRVAEELGHPDEHLLVERAHLARRAAEEREVVLQRRGLGDVHPPLEAADDGPGLVVGEVDPGLAQHHAQHRGHALLRRVERRGGRAAAADGEVLGVAHQLLGHEVGRGDVVDQAGGDGAPRHPVEAGARRLLHQGQPADLLDGADAAHAVRPGAGEHDADGAVALVFGEGAEEDVDREAHRAVGGLVGEAQLPVLDLEVLPRRDQVNGVGLDRDALVGAPDGHPGALREQLHHEALVVRREVLDDDEGHPAVDGRAVEEDLQRLEAAGGGAHPDHVERAARRRGCRGDARRCVPAGILVDAH